MGGGAGGGGDWILHQTSSWCYIFVVVWLFVRLNVMPPFIYYFLVGSKVITYFRTLGKKAETRASNAVARNAKSRGTA